MIVSLTKKVAVATPARKAVVTLAKGNSDTRQSDGDTWRDGSHSQQTLMATTAKKGAATPVEGAENGKNGRRKIVARELMTVRRRMEMKMRKNSSRR